MKLSYQLVIRFVRNLLKEKQDVYRVPIGYIKHVKANSYAGNEKDHPDDRIHSLDEICSLFKTNGLSRNDLKKILFTCLIEDETLR